jgi:hypothetical protein
VELTMKTLQRKRFSTDQYEDFQKEIQVGLFKKQTITKTWQRKCYETKSELNAAVQKFVNQNISQCDLVNIQEDSYFDGVEWEYVVVVWYWADNSKD